MVFSMMGLHLEKCIGNAVLSRNDNFSGLLGLPLSPNDPPLDG